MRQNERGLYRIPSQLSGMEAGALGHVSIVTSISLNAIKVHRYVQLVLFAGTNLLQFEVIPGCR